MTGFIIGTFTPIQKNSLLGFATVRMPSGLVFNDVGGHRRGGAFWALSASRPMLGKGGVQLRDKDGKSRWSPIASFANKQVRDRWSYSVIDALRAQRPEVLS
jgi:hypothetical protein